MEVGKMSVDKFNGSNFKQWKFQINCALKAKGLKISTPKPTENVDQWLKDDGMAMFIITSAMDLKQIALVENCDSAFEVMNKLETIYELKSELNKMMMHERFYQYKMSATDNIAQHIAKVESLAKQLKESGESISDTAIMTKILSSLPTKYRSLRQAWMSLDPTKQTMINLTARLLDEEASLSVEEESEMALFVANQKPTSSQREMCPNYINNDRGSFKHRYVCYNCGKRGHFAKDCRAPRKNYEKDMLAFHASTNECNIIECDKWILDSGASAHICFKKEYFQELNIYNGSPLKLGNQQDVEVVGQGSILFKRNVAGQWETSVLKDVLYVPELKRNLFSEGVATRHGYKIIKKGRDAFIYNDCDLVLTASLRENNLYELNMKPIEQEVHTIQKCDLRTWHERLGHINIKEIQKMCQNNVITGLDVTDWDNFVCEGCAYGKHARQPFHKSNRGPLQPGDVVYSDVCGPFKEPSIQGNKYFVIFKDAATSFRNVYFLKNKCDVLHCFKTYNAIIKNNFMHAIRAIHTDNGGEYKSKEFKDFTDSEGIRHEFTAPYTPEQNGRAEREIRTIVESARSMLYTRDVPLNLWADAINCAVYLLNRTSSSQTPYISPFELWYGVKPSLGHVRVFGCEGFVHVPDQVRSKLEKKSNKMMLVGYEHNNYRMYDPLTKKIVISRNVIFNERDTPVIRRNYAEILMEDEECDQQQPIVDDNHDNDQQQSSDSDGSNDSDASMITIEDERDETYIPPRNFDAAEIEQTGMNLRPRRNIVYEANITDFGVPITYDEAIRSPEKEKWVKAIDEELKAHQDNGTWCYVDREGQRTITSKWVFSIKRNKKI
jgi:transposase InsO family protein